MKRWVLAVVCIVMFASFVTAQEVQEKKSKFLVGFNLVLPTGMSPSTALTNGFTPLEKSYGLGMIIQREIFKNFSLFFDFNTYNYNNLLAEAGEDVQSSWTVAESAIHWNEAGAPQIQYVHNLPTDVHFDMQSTGFRLGGKLSLGDKKVRPFAGLAWGYYEWQANYFNEKKDKTYGGDKGYVSGLTYMGGIDFKVMEGMTISAFADLASPVAYYTIEGLFYDQWDIKDWEAHIMGPYRFGISLCFSPGK